MPEPTPTNFTVTIYPTYNLLSWTNVETDPASYVSISKKAENEGTFYGLDDVAYPGSTYQDTAIAGYDNIGLQYYLKTYLSPFDPSPATDTVQVTRWTDTETDTETPTDTATGVPAHSSEVTDTETPVDTTTAAITWASTITDTETPTDSVASGQSIRTAFAHYIGMDDGTVHAVSPDYLSDNGTDITSIWETIETHLGMPTLYKTVYRVVLRYVDKTASTPIAVVLSKDGGASWIGASKTVGTGDGKTHTRSYWFNESSEYFKFKVECASDDKEFQVIGLDVEFEPCGGTVEE